WNRRLLVVRRVFRTAHHATAFTPIRRYPRHDGRATRRRQGPRRGTANLSGRNVVERLHAARRTRFAAHWCVVDARLCDSRRDRAAAYALWATRFRRRLERTHR